MLEQSRLITGTVRTLTAILFFGGAITTTGNAIAHEGHAGPEVVFIKTKAALKQLFPAHTKITRRKEKLDSALRDWVQDKYGLDLDKGIYTYFLARDKGSGQAVGAAMTEEIRYRHGTVNIALGIDSEGLVTGVAVLSTMQKYVVDFENSPGTGMVGEFAGLSVEQLVQRAQAAGKADKPTRTVLTHLGENAVLLAAFMHRASMK